MSYTAQQKRNARRYKPKVIARSVFDESPTLIVNEYRIPNAYIQAVNDTIDAYKSGISFNKAVDLAYEQDTHHINRNKLAEHTLRTIANDY